MPETERFQYFSRLKRGTKLEKILCFITTASLLIIVSMTITLAYFGYHYNNSSGSEEMNLSNVCLRTGCVKAASVILSNIDESVDPCNDFHQFACGQWLKTHTIPEDKSSVSIASEVDDQLKLRLKTLLETKLDGTEPRFITMVKDLYDTCMDVESIENVGAKPLKKFLKSFGGWPVVEGRKWNENQFDWIETMISIRKLGFVTPLKCYIDIDLRNSSRNLLYLDETTLGMPDRTYLIDGLNDTATAAYFKSMVKAATLLGADSKMAESELLEVLQFEMTIANYMLPEEEKRNVSKMYNKYSIKQLQKMVPQVPWLKFFNGFLKNEVSEYDILIIRFPEFIKKLTDLVEKTEKRVIANYIFWTVVRDSISSLSKEWRDINLELAGALLGESLEKPRWEQCLPLQLDIALNSLYVRHHSDRKTKHEVTEIVNYVYKEFLNILENVEWMDEKTRAHAKAKADNMLFYISYPDELLNTTAIMEHYQNLTISNQSYFENYLRITKWTSDYYLSMLRKTNDRKDWKKYSYVVWVNALYSSQDNLIALPIGYLYSPFFDKDQPNYLNFGLIGSTTGHEITHGFDDEGRQFDKDGNNINWWESQTDENFRRKAQCIINMYNNFTAENGMKVNGINTLGENIADIAGVKESYLAYQSWVKDNGPEKLLPGLKYNQNQLFWISSAFDYCAKDLPEKLKSLILSDNHSPNEFRLKGPLSNLPEFARDFNCPLGSPMNRKHKCEVW